MFQEQILSNREWSELRQKILEDLAGLKGRRVIIVGDVGLDEYFMGDVSRISPEAPVPVVDVQSQEKRAGLAANVAQNIVSLGGEAQLVGVLGADSAAEDLVNILNKAQVKTEGLVVDSSRPTTKKTRVMAGHHHVVRVDFEKRHFLSKETETKLIESIKNLIPDCDGVVIEDYGKGLLSKEGTQSIIQMSHESGKKVIVDPHRTTPINYYENADLLKPNKDEAFILSGLNIDDLREDAHSLNKVAQSLLESVKASQLIITKGKEGMSIFNPQEVTHLPTFAQDVFDVTGAGDTVLATISMAWFSGWSLREACVLANMAAGVVVGQIGCVPCSHEDLRSFIQNHSDMI